MSYCENLVTRHDRDRFRLGLTAPRGSRESLWAVFAFNYEIAKTREVVSEPTLGLIRLQWWRDALDGLYAGRTLQHEGVIALGLAIQRHDLPRLWFDALLDARERDLDAALFAGVTDLEDYAAATAAPLNRLALKILAEAAADAALRNVSVAYALTGLLRAQPHNLAQNRNLIPHGVTARQLAERAAALLDAAGPLSGFLKASAALTRIYLARLAKCGYDLSDPRLNAPPVWFSVQALAGRFN